MGIWSGIKAASKMIFGVGDKGSDNIMTAAKGIGNWIDEQQLTDEERMQFNQKVSEQFTSFMTNTVNENTERSITRRSIAIWVIRFEICLIASGALVYKFDREWSEYLFRLATHEPLSYLVLGIGAFFYGAHLVRSYQTGGK